MNIAIPTNANAILQHTSTTYHGSLPLSTGSTLQVITTSASAVQQVLPLALSQTYKMESDMLEIPHEEGMTIYRQIKQRHSQLFRDLADL